MIEIVEDSSTSNGVKTQKRHAVDHDQDVMDRTNILQSFKLKIGDTLIPVKLKVELIHLLKGGISTRLGYTQELKSQRLGFDLQIEACEETKS